MKSRHAIVFLAWGEQFIKEVELCIKRSKAIRSYDFILITDTSTSLEGITCRFSEIIRAEFKTEGLLRKTEMVNFLPDTYDVYLFLDSDTIVLEDIGLGFDKAEKFGIALSPAPHYSLDWFCGFDRMMALEGMGCNGQLQYNTGVIFLRNSPDVKVVFQRWMELGLKYKTEYQNDQPFFSLAMEQLEFNPYTLSVSYNYRGSGDSISGTVRIWHSHGEMPSNINKFSEDAWPLRRAWPSKVVFPENNDGLNLRFRKKARQLFRMHRRRSN